MHAATWLHVEDDPAFRAFVSEALKHRDRRVESCASAVEALERLRNAPAAYGLVILDLVLPYLNGLEFLDLLRREPKTALLPVLITTGTFVPPTHFVGDPRVAILRKPFDDAALQVAIETLLGRAKATDGP